MYSIPTELLVHIISYTEKTCVKDLSLVSKQWEQAKEIKRIIDTYGHELDKNCLDMVSHISPIGWDNIVLNGEYVLDRNSIK